MDGSEVCVLEGIDFCGKKAYAVLDVGGPESSRRCIWRVPLESAETAVPAIGQRIVVELCGVLRWPTGCKLGEWCGDGLRFFEDALDPMYRHELHRMADDGCPNVEEA